MEEGTKSKKTVFVGGLSEEVDEGVIYETFSTFGDILEVQLPSAVVDPNRQNEPKHRGYGFVTFGSPADAQDAIDNMDMNELKGKVLKVNLARQTKGPVQPLGNRAVWESEEWLKQYAKPLAQSGGVKGRQASQEAGEVINSEDKREDQDNAMEETVPINSTGLAPTRGGASANAYDEVKGMSAGIVALSEKCFSNYTRDPEV